MIVKSFTLFFSLEFSKIGEMRNKRTREREVDEVRGEKESMECSVGVWMTSCLLFIVTSQFSHLSHMVFNRCGKFDKGNHTGCPWKGGQGLLYISPPYLSPEVEHTSM